MEDEKCTCDSDCYDEHPCPFEEDVNDNSDSTCNCCPYCTYQCGLDI